jgi:hypothetical protein
MNRAEWYASLERGGTARLRNARERHSNHTGMSHGDDGLDIDPSRSVEPA